MAIFSLSSERRQRAYYKEARDRMRRAEDALGIPIDLQIRTTQGMAGPKRRGPRVTFVQTLIFGLLIALNTFGLIFSGASARSEWQECEAMTDTALCDIKNMLDLTPEDEQASAVTSTA